MATILYAELVLRPQRVPYLETHPTTIATLLTIKQWP
jgi:hypothetical protein